MPQREKVPGCGEDGHGAAALVCPCGAGHADWACGCAGCWSGHGAGCCCCVGETVTGVGCDAVRGFGARFGFGLGSSGSAATVFLSGSAAAASLPCSADGGTCAASAGGWLPFIYSGG